MTCREMLSVVDAYLDGELSAFEIIRVHDHLVNCEQCQAILESEAALHSLLKSDAAEDEPPPELRARVLDLIGASRPSTRFRVVPLVLSGLVAVLFATIVGIRLWRAPDVPPPFALEIAAKHRLYTDASSASLDVNASDAVELTERLERHVGFPVRAPIIATPQQRLVGGRVSSVADGPAAYLLYQWHGRALSLFVTAPRPNSRLEGAERVVGGVEFYTASLAGVTLAWWDESGHLYAAVSDGPMTHLEEFAVLCVRGKLRTDLPARIPAVQPG
jgi:mycothiol system anti-sigma-R factor